MTGGKSTRSVTRRKAKVSSYQSISLVVSYTVSIGALLYYGFWSRKLLDDTISYLLTSSIILAVIEVFYCLGSDIKVHSPKDGKNGAKSNIHNETGFSTKFSVCVNRLNSFFFCLKLTFTVFSNITSFQSRCSAPSIHPYVYFWSTCSFIR